MTERYPGNEADASDDVYYKKRQIRAGIVGAGLIGYWHAKTIKKAGGSLSAIMDLNPDAARHLASIYRNTKSFGNIEEMLNQVDLDVLHICTPLSTHRSIAEIAINAGLNLIIEKPMTPMASETEYLFNKAMDRGLLICPVHQFIFQDGIQKVLEWLSRIGRLVHLEGTIYSAGGTNLASDLLDTIVKDILPHPLSLMQLFLPDGLPEKDWVTLRPFHGEFYTFNSNSGIPLFIFISMNARPTLCSFRIVGTNGTIHADLFHGFAFIEPGKVSRTGKILHPFDLAARGLLAATVNLGRRAIRWEAAYPGLQRLVSSFYRAVHTKTVAPISREDTVAVARVRDILI